MNKVSTKEIAEIIEQVFSFFTEEELKDFAVNDEKICASFKEQIIAFYFDRHLNKKMHKKEYRDKSVKKVVFALKSLLNEKNKDFDWRKKFIKQFDCLLQPDKTTKLLLKKLFITVWTILLPVTISLTALAVKSMFF